MLSNDCAKIVLSKVSSIVTDGTSLNTGEKGGLWTLFETRRKEFCGKGVTLPPLLKVWCSAHRASLVWKATADSVPEMKELKHVSELKVPCTQHVWVNISGNQNRY